MKVVWSRRAIRHVAKRILDSIDLLKSQPDMGRPGRVLGTRELVIPGIPDIIPYRVQRGRLELIAIFHGRQKWPPKF
jgi:toxin ParE1/3/4